ncbi:MAG: hypothetical protein ABSF77_19755 [Spirochaetia bacterium]|jgi:hypothetical protein
MALAVYNPPVDGSVSADTVAISSFCPVCGLIHCFTKTSINRVPGDQNISPLYVPGMPAPLYDRYFFICHTPNQTTGQVVWCQPTYGGGTAPAPVLAAITGGSIGVS